MCNNCNNMDTYNTTAYAYNGYVHDPYNAFFVDGGTFVENFNEWEVDDFEMDSLFGRNKEKKAEKKLRKAEKQLAKGHTKAAARKTAKAQKIFSKISAGQQATSAAMQQASDVKQAQADLVAQSAMMQQKPPIESMNIAPQSMAVSPMSETGSNLGGYSGGGGMSPLSDNTGVESEAPNTSDEPTGKLGGTKTMPEVVVTAKKLPIALILIGAVLILLAIVYFSKKRKR